MNFNHNVNVLNQFYKPILKKIKKQHKKSKYDILTVHHLGLTDSNSVNIRTFIDEIDDKQGSIVIFTKLSKITWEKKRCILYGMSDYCKESILYRLPYELNDIILQFIGDVESINTYVDILEFHSTNPKNTLDIITHLPYNDFNDIVDKQMDCYGQWSKLLPPLYPLDKTRDYYVLLFEIFQHFKKNRKILNNELIVL